MRDLESFRRHHKILNPAQTKLVVALKEEKL